MNFIDKHKNRVRESALQNPLKAYFLGGFETLPAKSKRQVFAYLEALRNKQRKN